MAPDTVRFRWTGAAVLRATTAPGPADIPPGLDLDNAAATRAWLVKLWQRPDVRHALFAASPVLTATVDGIVQGTLTQARQIRRAAESVASYLLRWQHRPTPFALFAGTSPLTVGTMPDVRWGTEHTVTVRADGEWISDVIRDLEQHPALLERLPIVANNTAQVRGDRLAAAGPPADGHAVLMAPVEVSVRSTRPVDTAMHAARTPLPYRALREKLSVLFPSGTDGKIDAVLRELIAQNLLITSLRPPMTTLDALDHVCTELKRADAHTLPCVAPLTRALFDLRDHLAVHASLARAADLREVTARMRRHSAIAPMPVLVDTALDCHVQLTRQVVAEVEDAVGVLHRVSPLPYGYKLWRDYHRRFRAEYGVGAAVPVLDLVADSGLGWPAEYVGSERAKTPRTLTERDAVVLKLLQQTQMDGVGELVLDDEAINELAAAAGTEEPVYGERSEIAFEVRSPSTSALAGGHFTVEITGVPRPGSSMLARAAHLARADTQRQIANSYVTRSDVITAQLSFGPRRRRNENVARTGLLAPHVIPLAEHPTGHGETIELDDIAVTADARSFYLAQLSTGRQIDVRVMHALEAGIQTPPLARFLSEITGARRAVYKRFDFGAAARLPYLPRVRYARTVLTPARWLLTTKDLPGHRAPLPVWEEAFASWRARLHVPDHVSLVEFDQRLPVDLNHPVHRRLIRAQLHDAQELELRESAPAKEYGWIGRAHEILLPLARTAPAVTSPPPHPTRHLQPVPPVQLPGDGDVLRMRLHGHPDRFDEILLQHLPRLLDALNGPRWWFTRHRELARPDTGQYLVLTVHPVGDYATTAAAVRHWATSLYRQRLLAGLTLEPYRPQTGRYGPHQAMDAAHQVFAADSAAALMQIRLSASSGIAAQALAAASLADLVGGLLGSKDAGWTWLIHHTPAHGRPNRDHRVQALQFYDAEQHRASEGAELTEVWTTRAAALTSYRQALAETGHDPSGVVRSLLHLHHVRALGVGTSAEAAVLHLARTVALRHRPAKATR
ncbi:lantibiotic dehydratase [Streptomyces sp. MAR4 CNY-716]